MSLLSKIFRKIGPTVSTALGTAAFGPVGGLIGRALSTPSIRVPTPLPFQASALPGAGFGAGFGVSMAALPRLPAIGTVAGRVAGRAMVNIRSAASSAATYCKRNPAWCSTIGGIAAVEALVENGQLPPIKRRRAKGITGTELKNFKRVVRFTSKFCAPVQRARRAPALRHHRRG